MNPLGSWGVLWYMPSLLILYITKLITTVGQSLEKLLVDLVTHVMGWVYLLSCLNILFENWIYSAAFIIYFLRLKYLPWLFANVRRDLFEDLTGIYNDPFNYQSTVEQIRGWKMITLLVIHQIIINLMNYYVFTLKHSNEFEIAQQEPKNYESAAIINRKARSSEEDNFSLLGSHLLRAYMARNGLFDLCSNICINSDLTAITMVFDSADDCK